MAKRRKHGFFYTQGPAKKRAHVRKENRSALDGRIPEAEELDSSLFISFGC
jgi:hypothetical protein